MSQHTGSSTAGLSDEAAEIIRMAKAHHDKIRANLGLVIEHKDAAIKLQGENGEHEIEAGTDLHKGVRIGIQIALSMIGEFPIKISKPDGGAS